MERADFEQWKAKEVARLLALVETERRYYQEMVATLPVALVVLSADRSIVSVNRAFRKTVGLRTEELLGKNIDQVLPSERLTEKIRSAHVQGMPQADVYMNVGDRPFRIAIVPIRNWDDETELETLLAVEDLSAIQAQIQARIQELTPPPAAPEVAAPSEAAEPLPPPVAAVPLEEVPSISVPAPDIPAVVWQVESETLAFTSVTGAAEALLGYPSSHWLETPQFFSERIHPDDRTSIMEFYQAAIAKGGDASAEYRAVSASGAEVWCRETIRCAAEGTPRLIHGVISDIGHRKRLEDQLLTAQRSQALHSLASRLSHDLNNPLMIVTGYGEEMLQALSPENPMRADVQQIMTATERIAGITAQLLEFTHRHANLPHPVDVLSILSGLENKITEAAGSSIAVEIALASSPVWALADAEQLEQIILALVSAAREDAQGRTRVTIACETATISERPAKATLRPGVYSRLVIHDNGRGLDARGSAAIFEAIVGPKTTGQSAAGSPTRAYAIVREWGGDIAFLSEPSRGSTFSIYLPYADPVPEPEPVMQAPVQEPASVPAPPVEVAPEPTRETILIVEDEPGIRALVRKILRRERYNVLEAGSGEEALLLAAAEGNRVDLLLTDVMLPGMSGRAVAERLREGIPELDVLYVSGFTDDDAVRMGAFPPGSKFLQKPFTLGALVSKVREALDA
jgi:two-component system, cell cycle sensor histidine kinase and response regulator CckA